MGAEPAGQCLRVALEPQPDADWLADAVVAGGGEVVDVDDAAAIIWTDSADPHGLAAVLDGRPALRWVQLPFAGVEGFVPMMDSDRLWTCAKGSYADPVAEFALALAITGMRSTLRYARATSWTAPTGRSLLGATVTIIGGGGIASSLVRMLGAFGCDITVLRRRKDPIPGAHRIIGPDRLCQAVADRDLVVLAAPLTADTAGMITARELEAMGTDAWLVNVSRGKLVDTEDLTVALAAGWIAGAALDVVDPEPLPDGHPLWTMPNCLIAPHSGNIASIALRLLAERVQHNVRRRITGEPLLGVVDPDAGY